MRFIVSSLDVGCAHVGVDLCGHQAFMSQQLLNAADICSTVEQVGSETMTECMWAGTRIETTLFDILLEHSRHTPSRQSAAEFVSEGRRFFGAVGGRPSDLKVIGQGLIGERAELTDPLFSTLPTDSNRAVGKIDIAIVHSYQFANPESSAVGDFKDRKIASAHFGLSIRCVQERENFFVAKKMREFSGASGVSQRLGRIRVDHLLTLSELKETPKRGEFSADARSGIARIVQCGEVSAKIRWSDLAGAPFFLTFVGDKVRHIDQILTIGFDRQVGGIALDIQITQELKDFLMHALAHPCVSIGSFGSIPLGNDTIWRLARVQSMN